MIKTLTNLLKQDKEKFVVPKGVQDCIPISAIYDDGIFRVGRDKYSKSFKFTDINYAVASREDKEAMFLEYSELLNSLDSGTTTKLTINNRQLNRLDFEKTILIPEKGDELDIYREEYNKMLLDKATGANATVQDKYVTISINKKNVEDARTYFARVGADLIAHFARLGSKCVELETDERLRIVHDFYRVGEETAYHFDIKETRKRGHDFKDYVCPDTLEFEKDYFKIGDRYGRVLFLREYASYIDGTMKVIEQDSAKTKSSLRTLPLVGSFKEYFQRVKESQELNKKVCGNCYNYDYDGYVFVNELGDRMRPNYLTEYFPKFIEKHGMPRMRFHDLRHSCASLLLANGVPLKQIQEWLGHSDFSTTANIYAHLDYKSKISSAQAMEKGMLLPSADDFESRWNKVTE